MTNAESGPPTLVPLLSMGATLAWLGFPLMGSNDNMLAMMGGERPNRTETVHDILDATNNASELQIIMAKLEKQLLDRATKAMILRPQ